MRNITRITFTIQLIVAGYLTMYGQRLQTLRMGFYNVENLFDTINHPLTNDDEFTPDGLKNWNRSRYRDKLDHIYKTITALGDWNPPALMGLCEVENREVVYELLTYTPFRKFNYDLIHQDSPDKRGIDVAIIYQPKQFRLLHYSFIRVDISSDSNTTTRDIVYACGEIFHEDTLHVFINHWPSRSGGQAKSEPRRIIAAATLKKYVDSLYLHNPESNILIMGDFNDEPGDKSLNETLKAVDEIHPQKAAGLYNCMYPYYHQHLGTEKFQDHWHLLDQVIVSQNMVNGNSTIAAINASIFKGEWLVEPDEKYLGERPYRTYTGPKYTGGYSDHFPVFVDIIKNSRED